jgi:hypothetical protein
MRRIRNKGVVYTGLVGAAMRMRKHPRARKLKNNIKLCGGPFRDHTLSLLGGTSLEFSVVINGTKFSGRYSDGLWKETVTN